MNPAVILGIVQAVRGLLGDTTARELLGKFLSSGKLSDEQKKNLNDNYESYVAMIASWD